MKKNNIICEKKSIYIFLSHVRRYCFDLFACVNILYMCTILGSTLYETKFIWLNHLFLVNDIKWHIVIFCHNLFLVQEIDKSVCIKR